MTGGPSSEDQGAPGGLRDALAASAAAMPVGPAPLEEVLRRGRTLQIRRRVTVATTAVLIVAVVPFGVVALFTADKAPTMAAAAPAAPGDEAAVTPAPDDEGPLGLPQAKSQPVRSAAVGSVVDIGVFPVDLRLSRNGYCLDGPGLTPVCMESDALLSVQTLPLADGRMLVHGRVGVQDVARVTVQIGDRPAAAQVIVPQSPTGWSAFVFVVDKNVNEGTDSTYAVTVYGPDGRVLAKGFPWGTVGTPPGTAPVPPPVNVPSAATATPVKNALPPTASHSTFPSGSPSGPPPPSSPSPPASPEGQISGGALSGGAGGGSSGGSS